MTYIPYNTGNELGSPDPRDSSDNKSFFDEFANSTSHTYVDRFGVTRLTMRGALARYASVVAKGDWTAATAYNQNDLWVDPDSGIIYIVLDDYTSGASAAGDIASGAVAVYQDPSLGAERLVNKTISSGAVTINADTERAVYISMTEDITSLTITGGGAGASTELTLYLEQDAAGYRSLTMPSNISQSVEDSEVLGLAPRDLTIATLKSIGSGWVYTVTSIKAPLGGHYTSTPRNIGFVKPVFNENAVFNNEFTSTAGWTLTNATATQQSASVVRFSTSSPTAGAGMSLSTGLASNRDWILYGKMKSSQAGIAQVSVTGDASPGVYIKFDGGIIEVASSTTGAGGETYAKQIAQYVDHTNNWIEFALHIDSNFGFLNAYLKNGDGSFSLCSTTKLTTFIPTGLAIYLLGSQWIDMDYLSICKPNIIAAGDSICAGAPGFDPNPNIAPNSTNYFSSWPAHCNLYRNMRNNIIVNKGIGAQTSTQLDSRFITDIANHGPRLVVLHASTNDPAPISVSQISLSTRTSNIQSCINKAAAVGAQTLLVGSMIGWHILPQNKPMNLMRDYIRKWEIQYLPSITGIIGYIDISVAVRQRFDQYMDDPYSGDPIHPSQSGYRRIGKLIESLGRKS